MKLQVEIKETITLDYTEHGEGTPVFFLPGGGATAHFYKPFLQKLAEHYRVIAFDYPGFDKSPTHRSVLDIDYYVSIIAAAISSFKFKHNYLIAHSMGGGVAVALEAAYPKLIKKSALLAPMLSQFSGTQQKLAYRVLLNAAISKKDKVLPKENDVIPFIKKNAPNAPEMIKQLDLLTQRFDVPRSKAKYAEKRVLLGGADVIFPLTDQRKLCDDLPKKKIVVYEKRGHDLMFSAEKEVIHEITEFFSNTV